MARRYKGFHHNLQDGENVVFHREHRSSRNRNPRQKVEKLQKFDRRSRRKWNQFARSNEFIERTSWKWKKRRRY